MARMKALPKWNPLKEKAPLSISRALQIATKWIVAREGGGKPVEAPDVDAIVITSLHSYTRDFRYIFYYRIVFSIGAFDEMACIVFMDGTVLEPDSIPPEKLNH